MKYILLSAMLIGILLSCKKEQSIQPIARNPFELWHSLDLHDYTIDQSRSCECLHGGELMRVTVRSDTIASVIRLSDTTLTTYPYFLTVDSLFGIIRNSVADSVVIRYNAQSGYPEYLDVDPQLHPVDGGFLYVTSNLQIPGTMISAH